MHRLSGHILHRNASNFTHSYLDCNAGEKPHGPLLTGTGKEGRRWEGIKGFLPVKEGEERTWEGRNGWEGKSNGKGRASGWGDLRGIDASGCNLLQNSSKTELIWFIGNQTSLRRLSSADHSLTIDSMDVQPSDVVRDLGVLLDSELTLKHHVNRIASTCFYHVHLRRLRQLRKHPSAGTRTIVPRAPIEIMAPHLCPCWRRHCIRVGMSDYVPSNLFPSPSRHMLSC